MAKFWKELIGGQVKNGIYVAGPRHASSKLGSFSSGNPPRLPFQYIVHFDINPNILGVLLPSSGPFDYAQMMKTIDMPSMSVTVEKKPKYNKNTPVIITKEFKPFAFTVHDDISSTWLRFWQVYYNHHFTDGRHSQTSGTVDVSGFNSQIHNGQEMLPEGQHRSQLDGIDIQNKAYSQFINNIHVYQLHGETVTRTTAVNPILTDVTFTPLDYAGAGTSQEITFNVEYEKLMYCPVINFEFDEDETFLKDAIEDATKATPFNPTGDKVRGLVKNLFGLTQRAGNRRIDLEGSANRTRSDYDGSIEANKLESDDQGIGFFGNLVRNAVRKKANELTDDLLKKNNKNLNKFNIN